jgi:four helix bundle protein
MGRRQTPDARRQTPDARRLCGDVYQVIGIRYSEEPSGSVSSGMSDYRNLIVWKRAHAFALEVYHSTRSFPDSERYGLTSQLRRAAISVVSNIAEGWGRHETRDQLRFLKMARGSICEVECQLLLSRDVGYLKSSGWERLDSSCRDIGKMLNGLIRAVSGKNRVDR